MRNLVSIITATLLSVLFISPALAREDYPRGVRENWNRQAENLRDERHDRQMQRQDRWNDRREYRRDQWEHMRNGNRHSRGRGDFNQGGGRRGGGHQGRGHR